MPAGHVLQGISTAARHDQPSLACGARATISRHSISAVSALPAATSMAQRWSPAGRGALVQWAPAGRELPEAAPPGNLPNTRTEVPACAACGAVIAACFPAPSAGVCHLRHPCRPAEFPQCNSCQSLTARARLRGALLHCGRMGPAGQAGQHIGPRKLGCTEAGRSGQRSAEQAACLRMYQACRQEENTLQTTEEVKAQTCGYRHTQEHEWGARLVQGQCAERNCGCARKWETCCIHVCVFGEFAFETILLQNN